MSLPREEHKKHSSGCAFLSVRKQFEELTLGEFLKLDKERAKNKVVRVMGEARAGPLGVRDTEPSSPTPSRQRVCEMASVLVSTPVYSCKAR